MTEAQLRRYSAAWYRVLGELTTLDAMIHAYPTPADAQDDRQAFELEDLARQLNALTAVWTGIPA